MTPTSDDRADGLTRLGFDLLADFQRTGKKAKAKRAIQALREALDLLPPGRRSWAWSNLGIAHNTRFLIAGEEADLTEALNAHRNAVNDATDPEQRAELLNNSAIMLNSAWEFTHDPALLDAAIDALGEGLAITPLPSGLRAELASNLGASAMRRFEEFGSADDLTTAIEALDTAVAEVPEQDQNRAMYVENAAVAVQKLRQARVGDIELLDRAIRLQRRLAVDQAGAFHLLGNLLHDRFQSAGSPDDLHEGVLAAERAIELADKGSRQWALALGTLAGLLVDRVDFTEEVADLDRAERALQEALAVTPADAPERPSFLNVLGVALSDRYDRCGDPRDRDGSRRAHQEAVATSTDPARAQYARNLAKHLNRYGHGEVTRSIAELVRAVLDEIITEREAHDRAAADPAPLSPAETEETLLLASDAAGEGETYPAFLLSSLLLARADPADAAWVRIAIAYLNNATSWLAHHPDDALFDTAAAVGEELLDRVTDHDDDDTDLASYALLTVARLCTDVVFGRWRGEDLADYPERYEREGEDNHWLRPDALAGDMDVEQEDPIALAERALELLDRALHVARGRVRGHVLVGLARVELLVEELGGQAGDPIGHAYAALRYLDRREDVGSRVYTWFFLIGRGERPAELPPELLPRAWSSVVAEAGAGQALKHVYNAARALSMLGAEDETREWLRIARPHVFESGAPEVRQQLWALEGHHLHDDVLECPEADIDVVMAAEAILEAAAQPEFSREQVATALVHLGYHAHASEQFVAGIDLLNRALDMVPDLVDRLGPAYTYILVTLCSAAALDHAKRGDARTALAAHTAAARGLLGLNLIDSVLDVLGQVADHAAEEPMAAVDTIRGLLPPLMAWLGDDRLPRLLEICHHIAQSASDHADALQMHQVIKGLRFAMAMTAPGPVPARPDEEERLTTVRRIEAELGAEVSAALAGVGVDDEMLMSSYIGLADVMSGRRPMLVAANVQRCYDRDLAAHVLRSRPGRDPYLTLSDVQSHLDDATVLVSVLLGRHGIQLLTVTKSDTHLDFLEFAESRSGVPITLLLPDHTVQMYGLGPTVAQLRREVREDPLFRPVTRQGQQLLTTLHSGCVPSRLAELRAAGKTHLCYWPHGPFHLIPFHLLGTREGVLADDWTVSVLPGLRALVSTALMTGARLLSVGCADGGVAYGLASEPSVEQQARAVASVFGTSALVGSAAAPEDVLRRMGDARYVHIAAHGSINEVAPSFHCLYLAGGRLFAHDLMRVDLTGVDIVTLSTCESALGRFDLGDDPRGIPAALFTAGVRTIVGCLWPVHPDPADLFFRTFYEGLLSGSGRLAAFRAAQIISREHYPAFRDWGAFVLIGQDHD